MNLKNTVCALLFAALIPCAFSEEGKKTVIPAQKAPTQQVDPSKPLGSKENPRVLQIPEGMTGKIGTGTFMDFGTGEIPGFSPNAKFDSTSDSAMQNSYVKIMSSLDAKRQDAFSRAYLALMITYSKRGDKGVEEFKALINGCNADEIILLGSAYAAELPKDSRFDASSEEQFGASMNLAMMPLDEAARRELAGAIAKVILKGAKEGKEPKESIKALHGKTASEAVEIAKQITDVELPENL